MRWPDRLEWAWICCALTFWTRFIFGTGPIGGAVMTIAGLLALIVWGLDQRLPRKPH